MRNQRAMLPGLVMLSLCLGHGLAGGQDLLPNLKTATTAKVGAVLSALYEEYTSHERRGDGTAFKSENALIRIVEDRVVIDAVASGETSVLRADLEALGMQKAASFGRMVSGQLPIGAIADVNALDSLHSARYAGAATQGLTQGLTQVLEGQGTLRPRVNAAGDQSHK